MPSLRNETVLRLDTVKDEVCITRTEYAELLDISRRYANLRSNLLNGGVDDNTVDLLSNQTADGHQKASKSSPSQFSPTARNFHPRGPQPRSVDQQRQVPSLNISDKSLLYSKSDSNDARRSSDSDTAPDSASLSEATSEAVSTKPQYLSAQPEPLQKSSPTGFERLATRTVRLCNLPDRVTYQEVVSLVRGGFILELFVRHRDNAASVSFLHARDASAFFEHVRRSSLYVKDRRVEVRWDDRQFILPPHLAFKVSQGHTRNFVIREIDAKHTEASIREDLDHIHNLVVIEVAFRGTSCHISTNSVANAGYARTCMTSRLKYKGSRIQWWADECSEPLEESPQYEKPAPAALPPPKKTLNPNANRFELLNIDD